MLKARTSISISHCHVWVQYISNGYAAGSTSLTMLREKQ